MKEYEKLGAFYLGREYDLAAGDRTDRTILYDSKDLTTHAVIIGMTGSGKTGLGIGLLEEALIDNIPVIAIDPKGDLPNLLLTFPELRPEDFRPWINEQEAVNQGLTPDQFAAAQAELWRKGLAKWDQDGDRIRRLREAVTFSVYTPGSSAGRPLNVLRSFAPPPPELRSDNDLWRETIRSTATSLLTLIGIDADPLTSREHILLANILERAWGDGRTLDLPSLIRDIQAPPFDRLGVLDLESFFPQTDRFALAMRLNNLLASPGFGAWLEGDPLDVATLLHGQDGRPRASVISIAHLSDAERMFFVTMLLNRIVSWMRVQPGTSSLRAILYIDEVFGYFPPVANPPSKMPLLTLLKQARAFGLGVVLATQNPVDLDYKGLSNAGTWFLGRLQTERDKARVLEGLESASGSTSFDRGEIDRLLSSVAKRVFLLHNVHESQPVLFETRWAMSYLRGPMTRDQIRQLEPDVATSDVADRQAAATDDAVADAPPLLPPGIEAWYLPASGASQQIVYTPAILGIATAHYTNTKQRVDEERRIVLVASVEEGARAIDWDTADEIDLEPGDLEQEPAQGASFLPLPSMASQKTNYARWEKDLAKSIRLDRPLTLFAHKPTKLSSEPGEEESSFRSRVAHALREERDLEVAKLRRDYDAKFRSLQDRLLRAQQAVEKEKEQATSRKIDTAISFGGAILGAFLGRKRVSVSSASRVGTAMSKASRIRKEQQDVARASERAESVQEEITALESRLAEEIAKLEAATDPATIELDEVAVRASSSNIDVELVALVWQPLRRSVERMVPDWKK